MAVRELTAPETIAGRPAWSDPYLYASRSERRWKPWREILRRPWRSWRETVVVTYPDPNVYKIGGGLLGHPDTLRELKRRLHDDDA